MDNILNDSVIHMLVNYGTLNAAKEAHNVINVQCIDWTTVFQYLKVVFPMTSKTRMGIDIDEREDPIHTW